MATLDEWRRCSIAASNDYYYYYYHQQHACVKRASGSTQHLATRRALIVWCRVNASHTICPINDHAQTTSPDTTSGSAWRWLFFVTFLHTTTTKYINNDDDERQRWRQITCDVTNVRDRRWLSKVSMKTYERAHCS